MGTKAWSAVDTFVDSRIAVESARAARWLAAAATLFALELVHATLVAPNEARHLVLGAPLSGAVTFALREYLAHRKEERIAVRVRLRTGVHTAASADAGDREGRDIVMDAVRECLMETRAAIEAPLRS